MLLLVSQLSSLVLLIFTSPLCPLPRMPGHGLSCSLGRGSVGGPGHGGPDYELGYDPGHDLICGPDYQRGGSSNYGLAWWP